MYDDRSHLQPQLAELKPDPRYLLGYAKGKKKNQQRREAVVPEEFWDLMPHLRSLAKQFIEKVYEQIFAMGSFDLIGLSLTFNTAPNIALARLITSRPKHPMIIIGGSVTVMGDLLLEPIRQTATKRSLPASAQDVRITAAFLGQRSSGMGAITQALTISTYQMLGN